MTARRDIFLIGGGGHARAVIDVIEHTGLWRIVGIVDPQLPVGEKVIGYPVLGGDDVLTGLRATTSAAHVTIGQIKSATPRMRVFEQLRKLGFELPAIVSPNAVVSKHASIADGVTVMHLAAVGPCAVVGANTIVNTRALIEHDCRVGSHCHISTAAVLNGEVEVGDGTFVGSSASVHQGTRIGSRCVIGMGVKVLKPVADGTVFIGMGAKKT